MPSCDSPFIQFKVSCLGNGASQSGWVFPLIKIILHRHVHRAACSRQFLMRPLSWLVVDCVKVLIKTNHYKGLPYVTQQLSKTLIVWKFILKYLETKITSCLCKVAPLFYSTIMWTSEYRLTPGKKHESGGRFNLKTDLVILALTLESSPGSWWLRVFQYEIG